jgi:23S rRNA (cytidine2498-2'-O)-methyltransferase
MEEGLAWSGLKLGAGETAVELGAAPGGAAFSLLERGVKVIGVDPAEIDKKVAAHPNGFTHLKKQALQVVPAEIAGAQWLFSDMNVAPEETLKAFEKLLHPGIKGGLLTLKLKDWAAAGEIPKWRSRIRAAGFQDVSIVQLFHNRMEVCSSFAR